MNLLIADIFTASLAQLTGCKLKAVILILVGN